MEKNVHKGHRERLRDSAQRNGIANLQEHQALELLLTYVIPQRDVNPIAHALIKKFGSFSNVLDARIDELVLVSGIGEKTAHFLNNFKEFFHLYKENKLNKNGCVRNTNDVVKFFEDILSFKNMEELHLICLDSDNSIRKHSLISTGISNAAAVNVRKITEVVISSNCHNVIICHNHPSGSSNPSTSDDRFTKALYLALRINNIFLLDHVIIGKDSYYSYNLEKKIELFKEEVKHLIAENEAVMQNECKYN